jgi:hypothetical protein
MGNAELSSLQDSPQPETASSPVFQPHPTRKELYAMGKSLREKCARAALKRAIQEGKVEAVVEEPT